MSAMASREDKRARSVRDIARAADSRGDGLRLALRRAEAYLALNERLAPNLPEAMRPHVRVACIEQRTLIIAATTPAWATQARLQQHQLLEQARSLWPTPLDSIRIIIAAPSAEP
jgi:hypothetical protein